MFIYCRRLIELHRRPVASFAVLTDATGSSTIAARWTYNGQMVSEEERRVTYKGAGATAFEFKSASGFPVGAYKVEILVDGQSVESRDFRVE